MARSLPHLLIAFRCLAAFAMPLAAGLHPPGAALICAVLLGLGVLSDIFDGVIARRLGVVTPALRKFDSRCDVIFWIGAVVAVLLLHSRLIAPVLSAAALLAVMEAVTHAVSFRRFGKEASPHHLLSKLLGLALWALFTRMMLTGQAGWPLKSALALGVLSQLEALAITLALSEWRADVAGLRHALRLRQARGRSRAASDQG